MVSETSYSEIKESWQKYLKPQGVKLPKRTSKLGIALVFLYENINIPIHIDDLKKIVIENGCSLTGTDPLQVRHLSTQYGWFIEKEGKFHHKLSSISSPIPGFIKDKRSTKLTAELWDKLLCEYNNMCANCGSQNGNPLRHSLTKITVLQQGHMDPRKDLTYDNCIPQCSFCNQQYKSKAIFNKRGIVVDFCKNGF